MVMVYLLDMRWLKCPISANAFIRAALVCLLPAAAVLPATDTVTFSIVGRIQFCVPGDWHVISSKSDTANTVFAFQIPNPADEGTPDSSNLVVIAYNLKDHSAKTMFEKKESTPDQGAQKRKFMDHWSCSTFSAMQGSTEYKDWDCLRRIADCGVYVRTAWPHLPKNPPEYDKTMEAELAEVLKSIAASPK
jgi:hypothetical protein